MNKGRDPFSRRDALRLGLASTLAGALAGAFGAVAHAKPKQAAETASPAKPEASGAKQPLYSISLAQWSLHKAHFGGEMTALDFPGRARNEFGIDAVEYVNAFFKDHARDEKYLGQLSARCKDHGVKSLLIMCDGEGALGDPDGQKRAQSVENHRKWLEAAKFLGCHSIRVNAQSAGSFDEQQKLAADGLRKLTELGAALDLNVIVENHGGLSSNAAWLAGVMRIVDHPHCGTLPDFGNFSISASERYDAYLGVEEMMPFAKAVSAKSYDFDDKGECIGIDFERMMRIVLKAGYHGYVGIEYEGKKAPEPEGVKLTKALLERVHAKLVGEGMTRTTRSS
ncbi:MAG: sugar phosphate isomerase/epimerase family protein [Planctomycetota bacterium]|nr:sugar phosphate isomerase/epimerase family protein [Planctomycetota bacterium]